MRGSILLAGRVTGFKKAGAFALGLRNGEGLGR